MPENIEKREGPEFEKVTPSETYGLTGAMTNGVVHLEEGFAEVFLKVCAINGEGPDKWIGLLVPAEMLGDLAAQLLKVKGWYENHKPTTPH